MNTFTVPLNEVEGYKKFDALKADHPDLVQEYCSIVSSFEYNSPDGFSKLSNVEIWQGKHKDILKDYYPK